MSNLNILPTLNFTNTAAAAATGSKAFNSSKGNGNGIGNGIMNTMANSYKVAANTMNSTIQNLKDDLTTPITDSIQNSMAENGGMAGLVVYMPALIALGALTITVILYVTFKSQIDKAIHSILQQAREALGLSVPTVNQPPIEPPPAEPLPAPQELHQNIMEKVLPSKKEVFNIASNIYTYADAAPLCKALGAELATYDQVKESYERGADWCNYGWIKGQAAVYPTQKATYDKLQAGPEDQRGACGQIGVNGGYFDNPGLRFGVNCYGVKPAQSEHSVEIITQGAGQPMTPETILFDKKVRKYAAEADTIGVLPFKPGEWSS